MLYLNSQSKFAHLKSLIQGKEGMIRGYGKTIIKPTDEEIKKEFITSKYKLESLKMKK